MDQETKYHPPLVFVYDNAVVRVHRPILTDAEREKRLARIREAAAQLLYEVDQAQLHNNGGNT